MKQVLEAVAQLLTQAARERAEDVMQAQANTAGAQEDYRSNAGGWN
ncbi:MULTISPECIES: hypothetical protein [unclassified Massilia]|nr:MULTISPECIES: hypothetical protein [unclassified Massilia]MBD8533101.1 hypothetical protein [Massilia sp. CFBP 13647]MBD8676542.1 hypothetical protein [Massilia sp. CFBP 13721]